MKSDSKFNFVYVVPTSVKRQIVSWCPLVFGFPETLKVPRKKASLT